MNNKNWKELEKTLDDVWDIPIGPPSESMSLPEAALYYIEHTQKYIKELEQKLSEAEMRAERAEGDLETFSANALKRMDDLSEKSETVERGAPFHECTCKELVPCRL